MDRCRICGTSLGAPIYEASRPAITSLATTLDVATTTWFCDACQHAQSPDIPDVRRFYDSDYQISTITEEHDQLYEIVGNRPVYRTERQAEVVLSLLDIPRGARVLDFGCAKAATLQKIAAIRSDIEPYAFDVSDSYLPFWRSWLPPEHCSTHILPPAWGQYFDVITAHFVLEHVVDPIAVLGTLKSLLKKEGLLFLSVPDPVANPGDLLVVDHLNHFTVASLEEATTRAGLSLKCMNPDALYAAQIVVAGLGDNDHQPGNISYASTILDCGRFWRDAAIRLGAVAEANATVPTAIYGAGFYGTWIATLVQRSMNVVCFIDSNRHLQNSTHLGLPVVAPDAIPTGIEIVFAGLNPARARDILSSTASRIKQGRRVVYLD